MVASGAVMSGAGIMLTARNRDGNPDEEAASKFDVGLIAGGIGVALLGALIYKSGMDAYNNSFMPTIAMPFIAEKHVGIAFSGLF